MKYLRILGFAALIGLAVFVGYQAYLYLGKGSVSINAKPSDASIVVDGTAYSTKNAENISLTPGEHKLVIGLDGFKTIEQTISMGWQDHQTFTYQLTPKPFKDIYQNLSPAITYTDYSVEQDQFFLNNTWAAGYIVSGEDEGDISLVVMRRVNGAWKIVIHDYKLPENAKTVLPAEVYNYVKDF